MNSKQMTKAEALAMLGGDAVHAALRIGITQQAISSWPQVLTPKLRDRVQAALWRDHQRHEQSLARKRARAAYSQATKREAVALFGSAVDPADMAAAARELLDQHADEAPNSPNTETQQ